MLERACNTFMIQNCVCARARRVYMFIAHFSSMGKRLCGCVCVCWHSHTSHISAQVYIIVCISVYPVFCAARWQVVSGGHPPHIAAIHSYPIENVQHGERERSPNAPTSSRCNQSKFIMQSHKSIRMQNCLVYEQPMCGHCTSHPITSQHIRTEADPFFCEKRARAHLRAVQAPHMKMVHDAHTHTRSVNRLKH